MVAVLVDAKPVVEYCKLLNSDVVIFTEVVLSCHGKNSIPFNLCNVRHKLLMVTDKT